ncbi:hypothetical protein BDV96DRAFT_642360 [Lophiotrema nucula]|uniref:F-box domain-containing protein n=1 Tax=Lophiotrema nucula TaxID=690887 RepID=A0A6A5ZIR3_9PLEO|nr:hypothetical protein BDV96DRAFT_642360 [Lophiotrema nucula]
MLKPDTAGTLTPGQSQLESLPAELLEHIGRYLPRDAAASFTLTSCTISQKLGTNAWAVVSQSTKAKERFIQKLSRDISTYAPCLICGVLRPFDSAQAWPLLKRHDGNRSTPGSFHAISSFLAQKVKAYQESGGRYGVCPSTLACSGTFLKPWATQDIGILTNTGFDQHIIQNGLPITYKATTRLGKFSASSTPLLSHVQYRIELPSPWSSFSTAERFAILRDFYLCPHIYASKLQYRDPSDPTYPADSSISYWLPDPIPESQLLCQFCYADFRAVFSSTSELEHGIAIDVWRNLDGGCNDGFKELVYCHPRDYWGPYKYGQVKQTFEIGTEL